MLQPGSPDAPYGIVGNGRLARHLTHYFGQLGLATASWARATDIDRDPTDALAACPVVLVLVADDAIEPFLRRYTGWHGATLIHASGRLVTALAYGMHPLSTFGPTLYPAEAYERIPFFCDANGPAFADVFPALPNPHFTMPAEHKGTYHAACVLAGNFTVLAWQRLFAFLEDTIDVPRTAAVPYLERVCANTTEPDALTGPVARRDRSTVAANLDALAGDPYQDVYRAFVRAVAPGLLPDSKP